MFTGVSGRCRNRSKDEEEDMTKKSIFAAVIALGLVFGAVGLTVAQDQFRGQRRHFDGPGFGGPRGGGFRGLDLSDSQKEQLKAIHQKAFESTKTYREQLRAIHQEMKTATANGVFNEAAVRAIAAKAAQVEVELHVINVRTRTEAYNILTPEQKAKMAEFEAKRAERRQNRRGPGKTNLTK